MFKLNAFNLNQVASSLKGSIAEIIANKITEICPLYGIDNADILHEFLANLLVECNEFTRFEENLNYSTESLIKKFGSHRISESDANKYGRNSKHAADKEMVANTIYGGDWARINLGNTMHGDGWLFRGSGPIQITGRGNVTAFARYYNNKFNTTLTPEQMAVKLRNINDITLGLHSACWLFAIAKKLIQLAIDDNMLTIVKKINGGTNGLDERMTYLQRAKKFIT